MKKIEIIYNIKLEVYKINMFQKQENILDINLIERDLNEQQREAVFSSGNSQLVLSGAGSGKTRVLTYKIIYLLKIKNIPPENILALTFTNKAAGEMKQRIGNLIGDKYSRKLVMGTFHSIFCKIFLEDISLIVVFFVESLPDFRLKVTNFFSSVLAKFVSK